MSTSLSASQSYSGNGIANLTGVVDNPTSSSVTWAITSPGGGSVSGGSGNVPPFSTSYSVSATVSGLTPGVNYTFRLLRSGTIVATTSLTLVDLYQIPSVTGNPIGTATSYLSSTGWPYTTSYTSDGATAENNNIVKSQSPSAGGWVASKSSTTIALTVYSYTPPSYPPTWTDNSLGAFVAGQAYSDGVSATNMGYSGVYSVNGVSESPTGYYQVIPGVLLNKSTGAVTGTPSSAEDYSFTITATNSYNSVSQAFSGTIAGGIRIWNGTSWLKRAVQVWDGSAWVPKTLKVWSGSSWDNSK